LAKTNTPSVLGQLVGKLELDNDEHPSNSIVFKLGGQLLGSVVNEVQFPACNIVNVFGIFDISVITLLLEILIVVKLLLMYDEGIDVIFVFPKYNAVKDNGISGKLVYVEASKYNSFNDGNNVNEGIDALKSCNDE
jgi:hypothetical protein